MAKPIRVLMVVRLFYPWVGGMERQAHKLAKSLAKRGIAVEISTGWWFRGTPQREQFDGIPVTRNTTLWEFFSIKGLRKFGGYLYIVSLLWHLWRKRNEYDLIHIHGLNYHTFAAVLAGKWFGRGTLTKLANSGQASDIDKMRQNKKLMFTQQMLPMALESDCFIAINKDIVSELKAAGVPQQKIIELTNGVEVDEIVAKEDYTLGSPIRIVFVGRLHEQKGVDTLLKAFQLLLESHPQKSLSLQLIGDGPLRNDLVTLAERLGVMPYVDFVGLSDQVLEYLHQADIFVLPSRAEGISNALLEAMSCALPVIVSQIPGNTDVVEHEKSGLLVPPNDAVALAISMAFLLERHELRSSLGTKARQVVNERYSLDSVAEQYISLYHDMLSRQKSSHQPSLIGTNEVHNV
jgi:glycosyltransferase involved in cell wall biosynthesis